MVVLRIMCKNWSKTIANYRGHNTRHDIRLLLYYKAWITCISIHVVVGISYYKTDPYIKNNMVLIRP